MKKLYFLLVILLCLMLVTGCGNNGTPAGKDEDGTSSTGNGGGETKDEIIELDMYFPVSVGGRPDAIITALSEQFHEEYPNIKVNPVYSGTYAETRQKCKRQSKEGILQLLP